MRVGALGDLLLLRRTIASLKQAGHSVSLLAPAASGSALVGPGVTGVDRCLSWDSLEVSRFLSGNPPGGALRPALESSDVVLAYTRDRGLSSRLHEAAARVVTLDPEPPRGHQSSWWMTRPLEELGVTVVNTVPSEVASQDEAREAERRSKALEPGFLAVHPGSGSRLKNWPASRFAALIESWRKTTGRRSWLLCLGPAEGTGPSELRRLEPDLVAQEWPVRSLGAVLAGAGAFVGNDSGATHLAAAWGAPTLALFGPTEPDSWSPCGVNTAVVRSPTGRMEDLEVGPVLDRLRFFM